MKKNTIIALVVAVLAVAGTVVFLWFYDKKQNAAPVAKPEPQKPTTPGTTTPPPAPVSVFPLKQGSKGEEVKKLQRKLNEYSDYYYFTMKVKPPYQKLTVDGDFGAKTAANAKVILGATSITKQQYDKFINQIIIPDTKPENPYLSDPFNFINF